MRQLLVGFTILLALLTGAQAQTVFPEPNNIRPLNSGDQSFQQFISGLPVAITPLSGAEQLYILQGNSSKSIPVTKLIGTSGTSGSGSGVLAITRAQIPATNIGANATIVISGFRTLYDLGYGATYTSSGTSCTTGLMYIKDLAGNCFNLVLSGIVNVGWFGAFADDGAHTIVAADITANPQWKGTYIAGQTWDYVAIQEAAYASFASASTPGNIVWNSTTGSFTSNTELFVPSGTYGLNATLLTSMTAGVVAFSGKQGALFDWVGTNPATIVWLCDHCSYSQFFNVSVRNTQANNAGAALPAFSVDSTSNSVFSNALLVQQNTYYDLFINVGINGVGMAINRTAGSQGDTQTWVNPIFIGAVADTGLIINSANALNETIVGGDFQGFIHQGIQVSGGQISTFGTHMENQSAFPTTTAPLLTQFTTYGCDICVTVQVNGSAQSIISGFRSEGDVLVFGGAAANLLNAGADVYASSIIGVDVTAWFTSLSRQNGWVVSDNANGLNTKGRMFMLVDSSGTAWRAITGGSGTTTIQDSGASYTANQWVGFNVYIRFGSNGAYSTCPVTSNTATSITYSTCGNLSTQSMYQVVGIGSGTEPNWDTVAAGHQAAFTGTGQGVFTLVGSTCVGFSSTFGTPSIGDWVVIPGADQVAPGGSASAFTMPLYAKFTTTSSGGLCPGGSGGYTSHATVSKAAALAVSNGPGYTGTPVTDGNLSWININPVVLQANYVADVSLNFGYVAATTSSQMKIIGNRIWQDAVFAQSAPGALSLDNTAHLGSQCASLTAASTISLTPSTFACNTVGLVPTSNTTLNAPVPPAIGAQDLLLFITTSGTTSFQITFGTNMSSNGVLNTGVVSGVTYVVLFRSNGTVWQEISRSTFAPKQIVASTVANLAPCDAAHDGLIAEITDAAASPAYNATVSGGGSIHLPVFCNGSNWTNH